MTFEGQRDVIEYYNKHPEKEIGLVFLDAKKVFDNLNWKFMLTLLEKMKMGEKYLNAIKAVYGQQEANLIIISDSTEFFSVRKGKRQGCPLLPLLFILVFKILLQKIAY